ncbi:MAG: hypothetical protein WCF84_19735 [Anaerolineae bacterium]
MSHTYIVKHLGIGSLARWGLIAGALVACLPALACSALVFTMVATVRRIVEGWRDVGITVLGQRLGLNMVDLLQLQPFLDALRAVDALGVFGILLIGFAVAVALGVIVAITFALVGLFYNLTGRMELELAEK